MANPIVAVVDSVFPTLDPAKKALKRVNAEIRMADEPTPEKILEVAADADGDVAPVASSSPPLLHAASITRLIKTKTIVAVPPRNKLFIAISLLALKLTLPASLNDFSLPLEY